MSTPLALSKRIIDLRSILEHTTNGGTLGPLFRCVTIVPPTPFMLSRSGRNLGGTCLRVTLRNKNAIMPLVTRRYTGPRPLSTPLVLGKPALMMVITPPGLTRIQWALM